MTGNILFAQPAHEVANAENLRGFWKGARALRDMLDQDRSLNERELFLIENEFHVLKMAYFRWKQELGA